MRYPCIQRDEESGLYFVAESTGPRSWRYHRTRWGALRELFTLSMWLELAALLAFMVTVIFIFIAACATGG